MKRGKNKIKETAHVLLIALAIIMFWRGVWGLMDHYLFPDNPALSYVLSIATGILILYLTENIGEHIL